MVYRTVIALLLTLVVSGGAAIHVEAADRSYRVIPNEYIVRFKQDITRAQALRLVAGLSNEHKMRLRHTFRAALTGFSAEIPADRVARLQLHPAIASIEPNGYWTLYTVDAPTNVTADATGPDQVVLNWTDNATTELGTEIQRSTSGINGAYSELEIVIGANQTSYTDNTVSAGQEFCYQIRVGESFTVLGPFSAPVCVTPDTPPPTPPADPTELTTNTVNDGRIDLAWNDNANNETGFRVERALGTAGAYAEIELLGSNVEAYQSTGLLADTEYCYRVQAFNADGDSAYSNESCSTTNSTPTDPLAAPSNVIATANGTASIDLSWTDNATAEVGFEVERAVNGGGFTSLEVIVQANLAGYTDNNVTAGVEHCYRVRVGQSLTNTGPFSTQACATPTVDPVDPPAAPSNLALTVQSSQRIDLSWADNANDETGFRIEQAASAAGPFAEIDVTAANSESYASGGLAAETQYCYRVQAFNTGGSSGFTAVQCATTDAGPVGCADTGGHDDLTDLYGITTTRADLNATWQASTAQGCGITPWLFGIDSGVDSDHPDLNIIEKMGFIAADPSDDGEDDNGHGTHTAGSAAAIDGNGGVVGVAPGAPIYGFRVCGTDGTCANDDIIAAVDEVTARKQANPAQPMVANMSLGGGASDAIDTAVRRSINAGVTYAIAAGNGILGACLFPGDAQTNSPARVGDDFINAANGSDGNGNPINGAITVTSHDVNLNDVNCNFGNPVTVAAPGEAILSTWLDGGYATISGTSMATPHVAGAALLFLARNPNATPEEVEQAIVDDLAPWSTNDTPNAGGRLIAEDL